MKGWGRERGDARSRGLGGGQRSRAYPVPQLVFGSAKGSQPDDVRDVIIDLSTDFGEEQGFERSSKSMTSRDRVLAWTYIEPPPHSIERRGGAGLTHSTAAVVSMLN